MALGAPWVFPVSRQQWMMRVLTGIHAGAEALLSDEEAVLGSAEDCDFVLDDAALLDRHIVLRADAGGAVLRVLDTGSPVQVDGRDVQGEVGLEAYQVICIGGLSLAVGPADAVWPEIDLPVPGRTDDAPEHPKPTEEDSAAGQQTAADATDQEPATASAGQAQPGRRVPRTLVGFGVGAVALVVVAGWFLVPRDVEPVHSDLDDVTTRIRAVAARHDARVDVGEDPDAQGSVRVTGFIDTEASQARMLADLTQAGVRATVHLVSTEELADYATSAINQSVGLNPRNDLRAGPVPGAPGELLVSGYVQDRASLRMIQAILERDVAEAKAISYRVQTRTDRLSDLRERLRKGGLDDRFRIQQFEDRVGLFGPVQSSEQLSEIRRLAETFNAEFDSRPALKLSGTDSFLGESTLELDVRAVVLGDDPHVVLHDGERYGKGSRVGGAYVIGTITERYIILELPDSTVADGPEEMADVAYFIFDA